MPPIPRQKSKRDREVEAALADLTEFESGFRRSARGNLYRHFEGRNLVVFERDDGWFSWLITGNEQKQFSEYTFEDAESAISDLWYHLGFGV